MPAQFNIYSSSAGSGKTFTLAKEYLKLALGKDSPHYFRRILAITFTNDAANEMKERILEALRAFSDVENFDNKSKFWQMFSLIVAETNLPEATLQFRAGQVYHRILQDFADFSVKTIDSFVNTLVSAFTDDLGLPFNYEIVLDSDIVLTEAVERLIEKAGADEYRELSDILEQYITEKAEDGKSLQSLVSELAKFGKHQLNDQFYHAVSSLEQIEIRHFRKIRGQMIAFQENFEATIVELAQQGIDLIESENLVIQDFPYKSTGIGAYFYNLKERFDDKVLTAPNSYHLKAAREGVWYSEKTTPVPIQAKIDAISNDLGQVFEAIEACREQLLGKYILYNKILPSFHRLSLLKKIKDEFETVLQEKNQVFIAEFNRKVLQIVLNEPVPFIYEKIGEKYNHILIDEFQDTSDMQFFNLLPLVENSLAKNHFNLLVGDAKQSIYRWRGGKMELIVHLYQRDVRGLLALQTMNEVQQEQLWSVQEYLNPVNLNSNYRSRVEVIDFNNDFFQTICEQKAAEYPFLAQVYADFEQQKPAHAQTGGKVQVELLNKSEGNADMLVRTHELIKTALAEGYKQKDIAILSRSKKDLAQLANYLEQQDSSIRLISQDSLLLKNAKSVNLVMAFLKVLLHPDNHLAKYEAAYLFHQHILNQIPDETLNLAIRQAVESPNVQDFYDFFAQNEFHIKSFDLQKSSLYEMVEKIIGAFHLFEQTKEHVYLFRLLDLVWDFGLRQSNHLADFLKYWQDKKNNLSVQSSDEQDAITITTIHKSKGLEYPVVIIPFTNWSIEPNRDSEFWVNYEEIYSEMWWQNEANEQIVLSATPFKFQKDLDKTIAAKQYQKELEGHFLENLNLLYVAFTRAVEQLYVLSELPKPKKKEDSKKGFPSNVGGLLQLYLDASGKPTDVADIFTLFEGNAGDRKTKIKPVKDSLVLRQILTEDRSQRLHLRRLSDKIFDEDLDKSKDYGNKVHAAFAEIQTQNDIPTALWKLQNSGVINATEAGNIRAGIEAVIRLPELEPLFAENLRIENEREILLPNGAFLRPDRVVFRDNTVHIIDYKTGSHQEKYEQQIRQYGDIYQRMYPEKSIALQLVYLEERSCRTVSLVS